MNDRLSIFLICLMLTAISGSMNAQQNQTQDLPLPAIPATLRTPDRKSTRLNSSHNRESRMPSSA